MLWRYRQSHIHIKSENAYVDLAGDVKERFDTWHYEDDISKNKKVMGLMKNEFGGKIMKGVVAVRRKMNSYHTDNDHGDKTAKTQKCVWSNEK